MPTSLDIAFAILFAVVIAAVEALYFDRRFKAEVAAGNPNARLKAYRRATLGQSLLALCTIAIWAQSGRPWSQLGVVPPRDWRLAFGLFVVAGIGWATIRQLRAIRSLTDDKRATLLGKLKSVEFILPHTPSEYQRFRVLSVTAGVCEELLYRGFLTWLLAAFVGGTLAIALVVAAFALAHTYQGRRGVIKTGLVGLIMSLIVVSTGWLLPAMIIHALIDLNAGVLGFTLLRERPPTDGLAAA